MKLLLGVACCLTLMACETGEEDRLAQAQACLDRATASTVSECEEKVAGITGQRAAFIRCSAKFIYQGFTGARFASAFSALKDSQAGQNSTLAMMSYLVFTKGGSDAARRDATDVAVSHCTETGMPGMIMFAHFAKSATEIATNIGITIDENNPPTPSELQADLGFFSGSDAELGSSVNAINTVYCGGSSSTKDAEFCAIIADAASQADDAARGARLRALLVP